MRYSAIFLVGLLLSLCSTLACANSITLLQIQNKTITIYDAPDIKSKTSSLAPGNMVILFFQQNDWIKIASPNNGQVGWVFKAELQPNTLNVVTVNIPIPNQPIISQTVKDKAGNSNVYSVMQYSTDSKASQQQAEHLLQQIQLQQQQMEERFNKMFAQPMVIIQQPIKTAMPAKVKKNSSN